MKGFQNVKISVSCRSKRRGGKGSALVEEDALNFKRMQNMVEKVGATLSNTVHKRVGFVVSTKDAFKGKTQRIRKAIKYKIPIVEVTWLQECISAKKMIDFHPYVLGQSKLSSTLKKETRFEK